MLFPSLSVSDHLATMLRRSAGQYDHGTPIPVDLNVSGHRQHGVFSEENWPVPTNGYPAWGWGGFTSLFKKAERTDRQGVCWFEETAELPGHECLDINSGYGTAPRNQREGFEGAVPRPSGTARVLRWTRSLLTAASKKVLSDAFGGFQNSWIPPTPFANARWGLPCHFKRSGGDS